MLSGFCIKFRINVDFLQNIFPILLLELDFPKHQTQYTCCITYYYGPKYESFLS
jgi:hypothetical protein